MKWFMDLDIQYKLSLIGILVTAIMSGISLIFSVRNNKAVHYVNAVTKNRVEWIYKLRELCAEYVGVVNIYDNSFFTTDSDEDMEKSGKQLSHCKELNSLIKLMLNYSDEMDRDIILIADQMMEAFSSYYHDAFECEVTDDSFLIETVNMKKQAKIICEDIGKFTKLLQIYLKAEWNRVKYESQGRTYEKVVQEFDLVELSNKYDDTQYRNKVWRRKLIVFLAKAQKIFPNRITGYFIKSLIAKTKREDK